MVLGRDTCGLSAGDINAVRARYGAAKEALAPPADTPAESVFFLTAERLIPEFLDVEELRLYPVEWLSSKVRSFHDSATILPMTGEVKTAEEAAVLMLTSGSTGTAKAVPLRHGQLLTALQGKKLHHGTQQGDVFLNWIGLDHVASLCEIHLHASRCP